jgi:hypothetical protein
MDGSWAVRLAGVASVVAQQAVSASYTAPRLELVHPPPGVSVPADHATVVFQYASTEVDPLDLGSLRVTVDGIDRTSHFRVTAHAAWGPIVGGDTSGIRAHELRARICSIRGVCVSVDAIVTVAGSRPPAKPSRSTERRGKIIDVVLEMARRLLKP